MYDYPTAFWDWGIEEQNAMRRVWSSNWFTQGPEVEALEHELAAFHGMKHAVACNSGSSANWLMVAALFNKSERPLIRGDNAVVPAISWATLYSPLVQHGMNLLLADVDKTWNAPWNGEHAGKSEKLLVGCPILGNPNYSLHWSNVAALSGAYFIEDCCESIGASIAGKLCGTFALMSSLSFFISHQLSAIEGGAVLTNDDECANLCRMLRNHGWAKGVDQKPGFENEYDFRLMGMNLRLTEMHAAIAREQLKKLPAFVEERRKNWAYFKELIGNRVTMPRENGIMNPFGLHFCCEDQDARSRLVHALRSESIDCRLPTAGSFRLHKYGADWSGQRTDNADRIHRTGIFLGNAPYSIAGKIEKAVKIMKNVL